MKVILTGLIVTAGEVNDGTSLHVSDFVSLAGLDLRHGEVMVNGGRGAGEEVAYILIAGNKGDMVSCSQRMTSRNAFMLR